MKYEHYTQPILPFRKWVARVCKSIWLAATIAIVMLAVGIIGYHEIAHLPYVDSLLEASMILAGMGPVAPMNSVGAKLFASFYALLSGLVIIGTTGLLLAPFIHRMLHYFNHEKRPAEKKK